MEGFDTQSLRLSGRGEEALNEAESVVLAASILEPFYHRADLIHLLFEDLGPGCIARISGNNDHRARQSSEVGGELGLINLETWHMSML